MVSSEVFSAVQRSFMINFRFISTIIDELGLERTVELMSRTADNVTNRQSQSKTGNSNLDARAAWATVKPGIESLGYCLEVAEENPNKIKFKCVQCPTYAAAHAVGMDNRTTEAICRASTIRLVDANVKRLNPDLTFRVTRFRSSPADFCEEEIAKG
jgi:hypothetical protein